MHLIASLLKFLRDHWMVVLALALTAGLRLVVVAIVADHPERYANFDGAGYDQLGWNLVQHGEFSQAEEAPFVPDNYRTPLYPAYIALHYWLLGHQPVSVLISQALILEVTSCLVLFLIGKRLFGYSVGVAAAILFALSPISIDYAGLLWSDTLFTVCLILGVWRVVAYFDTCRRREIFAAAVLLGVATLVHPRSILLPLALLPFVLVRLRGWYGGIRPRVGTRMADAAILIAVFAMVLTPWVVRNYITFGVVNIASVADLNLLAYNAGAMEAERTGTQLVDVVAELNHEAAATSTASIENEAQQAAASRQVAFGKILAHPFDYLVTHLKGVIPVLTPGARLSLTLYGVQPTSAREVWAIIDSDAPDRISRLAPLMNAQFVQEAWPEFADAVFLVLVYSFGIWGAFTLRRGPWGWLILIVALYLVLLPGPAGAPRYRVPAVPYMVLLAAVGMESVAGLMRTAAPRLSSIAPRTLPGPANS